MIAETSLIAAKWKCFATVLAIGGLWIADESVMPKSYEDVGLKGLLIVAVAYLVRTSAKQQEEHKAEMKEQAETHLEASGKREDKMTTALTAQTDALNKVAALTQEQTEYFKTVTRGIVDDRLKSKPNLP